MSQRHGSVILLANLLSKDRAMVSDDGLDARLLVHIYDELLTARSSHHIRPGLVYSLAYEEILELLLHPLCLVVEFPVVLIYCIEGDGVVVE